jgi:hypothetical protein
MENAIMGAVFMMLNAISDYMWPMMGLIFTFALAVLGMRLAMGETQMAAKATTFAIKMGLVLLFAYNLGGFGNAFFAIENQLITMVSGGVSPWTTIDRIIGKLLGFGPTLVIVQGLIAMIGSALFSTTAGTVMFMVGIMAVLGILRFIFDVVYTYVTAVILIGFMLILSPLLIPLAMFFLTERYFRKWLDIIFSVMLTPILMFAFLTMFLAIFSPLVADVFKIMGFPCANPFDLTTCRIPDFSAFWKMNKPDFAWLMANDPNVNKKLLGVASSVGGREGPVQQISAVQPFLNPWLKSATNAAIFALPGINFGADDPLIKQKLTFALFALWIFSALMRSMLNSIPHIASSIAGVIVSVPFQNVPMQHRLREGVENAAIGAGGVFGGALGGMGGVAAAKSAGLKTGQQGFMGEVGGLLGGVTGALFGKELTRGLFRGEK